MILEYSYDKANKILEYMKESKLASLTVLNKNNVYIMEYTLISDHSELMQRKICKVMSEVLPERLNLINVFNRFIENMITGTVASFHLEYNAVAVKRCKIAYAYSFDKNTSENSDISFADAPKSIKVCLEQIDKAIKEMGISDIMVPDIYIRTKVSSSGKRKSYNPISIKDLLMVFRRTLTDYNIKK